MSDRVSRTKLELEIGTAGLKQAERSFKDLTRAARELQGVTAGAISGGAGGVAGGAGGAAAGAAAGGGGGGGAGQTGAGGPGQQGTWSKMKGRARGGLEATQGIGMPSETGVARMLAAAPIPLAGMLSGAIVSMFHNYRMFEANQMQRLQTAPFGTPVGAGFGAGWGYSPSDTLQMQAGLGKSMGRRAGAGLLGEMMPFARAYGLSGEQMGGFFRPGVRGGGGVFGGEPSGEILQDAVATGITIGFDRARIGEYLESVQNVMTEVGRTGVDVSNQGLQQLMMALERGDPNMFGGQRAVAGARGVMGLGRQMLGPGGADPFVTGAMLRQVGFGKGKNYWESMMALQSLQQGPKGPQRLAAGIMRATDPMGPIGQKLYLQRLMPQLSPHQIEAMYKMGAAGIEAEGIPEDVDVRDEGKAQMRYGGREAAYAAERQARRMGMGRKAREGVQTMETAFLDFEESLTDFIAPKVVKAIRTVERLLRALAGFDLTKTGSGLGYQKPTWGVPLPVGTTKERARRAFFEATGTYLAAGTGGVLTTGAGPMTPEETAQYEKILKLKEQENVAVRAGMEERIKAGQVPGPVRIMPGGRTAYMPFYPTREAMLKEHPEMAGSIDEAAGLAVKALQNVLNPPAPAPAPAAQPPAAGAPTGTKTSAVIGVGGEAGTQLASFVLHVAHSQVGREWIEQTSPTSATAHLVAT